MTLSCAGVAETSDPRDPVNQQISAFSSQYGVLIAQPWSEMCLLPDTEETQSRDVVSSACHGVYFALCRSG